MDRFARKNGCGTVPLGILIVGLAVLPQFGSSISAQSPISPKVIRFDPAKQSADSLSKFVTDYDYVVKEIKVVG